MLYQAWRNIKVADPDPVRVYALRTTASLFGHNAPKKPLKCDPDTCEITESGEWPVEEKGEIVYLDAGYDKIAPGSWVVVEMDDTSLTDPGALVATAGSPNSAISRADYGISGKTTRIELRHPQDPTSRLPWITKPLGESDEDFEAIRYTIVHTQSEVLDLAEEQIDTEDHPEPIEDNTIELDGLYDGLEPGRWLIVSGERADAKDGEGNPIPGMPGTELVMLAAVEQNTSENLPGDTPHTTLVFDNELAHTYKRDTVTIYGNVVKATHGETREEVLGSGDGSQGRQQFALKQSPLTHLAAPTPAGAESTLQVRVDDVLWHETERMVDLEPDGRAYITRTDDEQATALTFGDGKHGARLPTGVENVRAVYRSGIGRPGNVPAEQISLLATRPLGVKGVINPLPATGGADRESRDQARRNVPLAILALDRLVSVQDYADFCRTYAGIAKASAARLSDGRREVVHLTIAGVDDIPIEPTSDLYRNLHRALRRYGDPRQPIQIDLRELMLLVIRARVRLHPDYLWESVAPKIRAALLDAFGFDRRELGQDVLLADVIATIQGVPGVTYVDVDLLESISESEAKNEDLLSAKLEDLAAIGGAGGNGTEQRPRSRIPVQLAWRERIQIQHLIQPGDTLWSLARRYETTVAELVRLNGIVDPDLIYSGDILFIGTERLVRRAQLAIPEPRDTRDTLPRGDRIMSDQAKGQPLTDCTNCCRWSTASATPSRASRCGRCCRSSPSRSNVVEADIDQLYENWFIETCEDWVVPYIGDLVGYRAVHEAGQPGEATTPRGRLRNRILIPRREVANTIRYRRRKGTLALLELLAARRRRLAGARGRVLQAAGLDPGAQPPAAGPGPDGRPAPRRGPGAPGWSL